MEYYSAIKKEILPFATTWMTLEGIVLNKSKTKTNTIYDLTYMQNLKNKRKQTHRYKD